MHPDIGSQVRCPNNTTGTDKAQHKEIRHTDTDTVQIHTQHSSTRTNRDAYEKHLVVR